MEFHSYRLGYGDKGITYHLYVKLIIASVHHYFSDVSICSELSITVLNSQQNIIPAFLIGYMQQRLSLHIFIKEYKKQINIES
jgi:hypothetical protein